MNESSTNHADNLALYLSIGFVVLLVLVAGYLVITGSKTQQNQTQPTPTPQVTLEASPTQASLPTSIITLKEAPTLEPTSTPTPTSTSSQTLKFEVSGTEYSFNPSQLTVPAGSRVQITFKNEGKIPHNWAIPSLGVTTRTINAGETDVVTFTAPKEPTTAPIRSECTLPGHAERGMVGTLVVK